MTTPNKKTTSSVVNDTTTALCKHRYAEINISCYASHLQHCTKNPFVIAREARIEEERKKAEEAAAALKKTTVDAQVQQNACLRALHEAMKARKAAGDPEAAKAVEDNEAVMAREEAKKHKRDEHKTFYRHIHHGALLGMRHLFNHGALLGMRHLFDVVLPISNPHIRHGALLCMRLHFNVVLPSATSSAAAAAASSPTAGFGLPVLRSSCLKVSARASPFGTSTAGQGL